MHKSGTERGENHVIAFLKTVFILPNGQWNGGGTGITEVLDIHHHLFHRNFESLGNGLNDTHVGLMRYNPLDVILVKQLAKEWKE